MKERGVNPQRTPAQIRREIKIVRQLVNEGRISSEILERRQAEYQIFPATEPAQTPPIQPAVSSLEISQADQEKKEELPHLKYWKKTGIVDLYGKEEIIWGELNKAVLEFLLANPQRNIAPRELTKVVKKTGSKSKRDTAGYIIRRLRHRLEKDPQNPQVILTIGKTSGSFYHLNASVEIIDEEKPVQNHEPKAQVRDEQEKDWENAILEKDGQTLRYSDIGPFSGNRERLLKEIWGKDVPISTLYSTLYPELSREKATSGITSTISRINKKLQGLDWQIINLVTKSERNKGKESVYTIAPIERVKSKEKAEEVKTKGLSEDEVLKKFLEKITPNEKSIVNFFIERDKHGLREATYAALTHYMYGEIPKKVRYNRLSVALVNLRKKLAEVGYEIVSEKKGRNTYMSLEKKTEEQGESEILPDDEGLVEEEVDVSEVEKALIQREFEEPEFIPYKPSEEEKRTRKETIVLDTIVSMLLSNSRIRFEELQKYIVTAEGIKKVLGGEMVFIYPGEKIKELFVLALSKIREEAEIQGLRGRWSEEDQMIWEKVDQAINRIAGDDVDFFIRKVKEEISRSERQFYRDYPSSSGQKITWLRRRHHE